MKSSQLACFVGPPEARIASGVEHRGRRLLTLPPFQGGSTGSNPVGDTTIKSRLTMNLHRSARNQPPSQGRAYSHPYSRDLGHRRVSIHLDRERLSVETAIATQLGATFEPR